MEQQKLDTFILENCERVLKTTTIQNIKKNSKVERNHNEDSWRIAAKPQTRLCLDCNQEVTNRVILYKYTWANYLKDSKKLEIECKNCGVNLNLYK